MNKNKKSKRKIIIIEKKSETPTEENTTAKTKIVLDYKYIHKVSTDDMYII